MEQRFNQDAGINFRAPVYLDYPTRWADMVNCRPMLTPQGVVVVSDFGYVAMGAEISAATHGLITHLDYMAKSDQTLNRYGVGQKHVMRYDGTNFVSIHDATAFTAGTADVMDAMFLKDAMYFASPIGDASGTANALRKHTGGAGAITVLSGTQRNSRFIRPVTNRIAQWGTYNGATYDPTDFRYSERDLDTTWSDKNSAPLTEQGDQAAGMEQIEQVLMLFRRFTSPILVEPTGNFRDPFNFIPLPGSHGLINTGAFAKCGENGVGWCGLRNLYLFRATRFPVPIGGPVLPMLFPVPSGSRVIGGYDQRRGDRETLYFFTNIATALHAANIPNAIATTFQYLGYDINSELWFRGDLAAAPYAFGNYVVQAGDRDQSNATIIGSMFSLASGSGNSRVYDVDHAQTQRAGSDYRRSLLTPVLNFGTIKLTRITKIAPIFTYASVGTLEVSHYGAHALGQRPEEWRNQAGVSSLNRSVPLAGDPKKDYWVDYADGPWMRAHQIKLSTTSDVRIEGIWLQWEVGNY